MRDDAGVYTELGKRSVTIPVDARFAIGATLLGMVVHAVYDAGAHRMKTTNKPAFFWVMAEAFGNFIGGGAVSDRFFSLLIFLHIGIPLILLLGMWIHIQRISRPGRRVYFGRDDVPDILAVVLETAMASTRAQAGAPTSRCSTGPAARPAWGA